TRQVDLRVVDAMARQEARRPHRLAEELEDRVAALERVLAAAVGGDGIGGQTLGHLVPELLVETSHVAVLEPLDELDLDHIADSHGPWIRERRRERQAP